MVTRLCSPEATQRLTGGNTAGNAPEVRRGWERRFFFLWIITRRFIFRSRKREIRLT